MRRGAMVGVLVLAVLWPAAGAAQEPPETTVPPDTTVAPPTTVPPSTTVPEPPTTTVPTAPPTTTVPTEPPPTTPEAADEGTTSSRTLAVRPHDDLVDRQEVVVRGRGWRPRASVFGAMQCRAGIAGFAGCDRVTEARTDARGNFRVDFEVQVILETETGTYDCRLAPCVIRAIDERSDGGSRSVRLFFDPAGPDPVREEVTITPADDLVDGQVVTVVGEDFDVSNRWGSFAELVECRLPVVDRDDCDDRTESYAEIGSDGYLATTYRVEGLLRVDGADVDCRTSECALLVGEERQSLAHAALVPLAFDPNAPLGPPPTVTLTPSTDLRDGQIVDVDGEGLQAGTFLFLVHCRWGATDFNGCSTDDLTYAKVRADGTFHTQLGLRAVFRTSGTGGRVNCRIAACSLTAFGEGFFGRFSPEEGFGFGGGEPGRVTRTRLWFDPDAPLLEPTIGNPDLTGIRDESRWRIHGTGGRPEGTVVLVQCMRTAQSLERCAPGSRRNVHSHFEPRARIGVSWETRYQFERNIVLDSGRHVDCAVLSCSLVAMERGGDLDHSDRIAISFVE